MQPKLFSVKRQIPVTTNTPKGPVTRIEYATISYNLEWQDAKNLRNALHAGSIVPQSAPVPEPEPVAEEPKAKKKKATSTKKATTKAAAPKKPAVKKATTVRKPKVKKEA